MMLQGPGYVLYMLSLCFSIPAMLALAISVLGEMKHSPNRRDWFMALLAVALAGMIAVQLTIAFLHFFVCAKIH